MRRRYRLVKIFYYLFKISFLIAAALSPLSMRIRLRRSQELSVWTPDTTLVIIDMQEDFPASNRVLKDVLREVEIALLNGWAIVVLEYHNQGPTHPEIMRSVKQSSRHAVETKYKDDGGREVHNACKKYGFPTGRLRVCGVNTHACVNATVWSLCRFFRRSLILIVRKACAHGDRKNNWQRFFFFKSYRVVPVSQEQPESRSNQQTPGKGELSHG